MPPPLQDPADLEEDAEVVVLGSEVAERGEEARDGGEPARREGEEAHVGPKEAGRAIRLLRPKQERLREIEPEDAEPALSERPRVPTRTARQVQDRIPGREIRCLEEERHATPGLVIIPVRIELQIVGPEPACVPRQPPGRNSRAIRIHGSALW